MNIKQIRNATLIVTYGNEKFLVDPFLADKDAYPAFPFTPNDDKRNPLVKLPVSMDEILNVDAVIVTHTHPDHFDPKAHEVLPKDIKIFVQNKNDANELRNLGFKNIEVLSENGTMSKDIKLTKTNGIHGVDEIVIERFREANATTEVCGVIFNHKNEETLYIAGDTVWCDDVKNAIHSYNPEIIILNAGNAEFIDGKALIMGKEDVYEVCKTAPSSKVIASHMEAVNHATLSRKELKEFAKEKGLSNLLIPEDGEEYTF